MARNTSPLQTIESRLDEIFDVAGTEDSLRENTKKQIFQNLLNLLNVKKSGEPFSEEELHHAVVGPLWGVKPFYRLNQLRQPNLQHLTGRISGCLFVSIA
ncbi:MAG: hypothetical protein WD425_18495 [Nitrospirales bacterium]